MAIQDFDDKEHAANDPVQYRLAADSTVKPSIALDMFLLIIGTAVLAFVCFKTIGLPIY